MEWKPTEEVWPPGQVARGDTRTYLVVPQELEGSVSGVRLTRWLNSMTEPAAIASMASRTTISLPLGRGPGRPAGSLEVQALVELAKDYAEGFERGEDINNFRQWQHSVLRRSVPRKLATDADH
jgi:hypothetical protein